MDQSKPWYLSRTIWASLVSIAASLGAFVGYDIDDATRIGLTDAILQVVAALAGITAIAGRVAARSLNS